MCVHRREIYNPYTGKPLVVDCGHCPACLQAKANRRASRIKQQLNDHDNYFVTLTYDSRFAPYIYQRDLDDRYALDHREVTRLVYRRNSDGHYYKDNVTFNQLVNLKEYHHTGALFTNFSSDGINHNSVLYRKIPVYRDFSAKHVKSSKNSSSFKIVKNEDNLLCYKEIPFLPHYQHPNYRKLVLSNKNGVVKKDPNKISVIHYDDLRQFIKNLRHRLHRDYQFFIPFHYFACSEYGPTSGRAHFHILLSVPRTSRDTYALFYSACRAAWPYDGHNTRRRFFERAVRPARYVASYINSLTSAEGVLQFASSLKPSCSHSLHYGFANPAFTFDAVQKAIERGHLRYHRTLCINNAPVERFDVLPLYVTNRYFPKFAGYSRLTDNEAFSIYERPECYMSFYSRLGFTKQQAFTTIKFLENKQKASGLSPTYFAHLCVRCQSLRQSEVLRSFYEQNENVNPLYIYDNIEDYYRSYIDAPTLDVYVYKHNGPFITDFNEFPPIVKLTNELLEEFDKYDKSRKVKNQVYSTNYPLSF